MTLLLVYDSTPSLAQDDGNALMEFHRRGYADALGENDLKVQGLDKRIELQSLGFRNSDIRTSTASTSTRSLARIVTVMAKKIADLQSRIATLEKEVAELREVRQPIDYDDSAK